MKKYAIIVYWSDEDAVWIAEAPDLDPRGRQREASHNSAGNWDARMNYTAA